MAKKVIGIDLGTTNSAVAYMTEEGPKLIPNALGSNLTPSVVGLDADGTLTLMDEVLTPDSSRYWPADTWQEGANPPSFDKQFLRDWLEQVRVHGKPWDKQPPAPRLPQDVIDRTASKYREALERLTG